MNIALNFAFTLCSSLCQYLFPCKFHKLFEKQLGNNEKPFFCLVSLTLLASYAIILENKSYALVKRPLTLRVLVENVLKI